MSNNDYYQQIPEIIEQLKHQASVWFSINVDNFENASKNFAQKMARSISAHRDIAKFTKTEPIDYLNVVLNSQNVLNLYPEDQQKYRFLFNYYVKYALDDELKTSIQKCADFDTSNLPFRIENFSDDGTNHSYTIHFSFSNKSRTKYFKVDHTLNVTAPNKNPNMLSFSFLEDSVPYPYGVESLKEPIMNAVHKKYFSSGNYSFLSFIKELVSILSSPDSIANCVGGQPIDPDNFYGPKCAVTLAYTYGDYVTCPIRRVDLHRDCAVEYYGNFYHPDVLKTCAKCGQLTIQWLPIDSQYICGECHAKNG